VTVMGGASPAVRSIPRPLTGAQLALVERSRVVEPLVRVMARRTSSLSADELRSIAHESLLRAAQLFDPARGVPFDGYAYRFVRLDLQRAIGEEGTRSRCELALLNVGCDALESIEPPDPFATSQQHSSALSGALDGMFAEMLAGYLGAASRGLSEADLAAALDGPARFRRALDDLGARGDVLRLRYVEELGWDDVAARLQISLATARRQHDDVLRLVMARLTSRG
jgi:DNA-directed RNA polymerase specialized sigma24 family protein